MKRLMCIVLLLALLIPGTAMAERLQFQVMDNVTVDAEVPANTPSTMAELQLEPVKMNPEVAQRLLMPGNAPRRENTDPQTKARDVQIGDWEGKGDYIMVEVDNGRICYASQFYSQRIADLLNCEDEMTDHLHYYPEDREVEGFPRADAMRQASELLEALEITDCVLTPRILTFDVQSYDVMLEDLSQADRQAMMPRIYLEPYDTAHDGYIFVYQIALDGMPLFGTYGSKLVMFISRQGIEYLETGNLKRIASRGEKRAVISAEDALRGAVPQIEAVQRAGKEYVIGMTYSSENKVDPVPLERIRLGYAHPRDKDQGWIIDESKVLPVWEYSYQRAMWTGEGTWQTRSFDNAAFLGWLIIHATSGEYIDSWQ